MAVPSPQHTNIASQPQSEPDAEPRPHLPTRRLTGTVSRSLRLAVVWLLLTAFALSFAQPVPCQGVPGGAAWLRRSGSTGPKPRRSAEYARVLFGLGLNEQGREQTELALSLPAHTAVDSYEQARVRALLAAP